MEDQVVIDAGCGAGRWAYQVGSRGPRVIAVDLGQSVEIAARNTASTGRVACVQGDLQALPIASDAADWAYSLGVLHHMEDPEGALRLIARAVRGGGSVLLYLYYALDDRGPAYRVLFSIVDAVRRISSRLPRSLLVAFASVVAVVVYWPLARIAGLAAGRGARRLANAIPLSFYRDRSLRIMLNDSVDRFGTTLERRYTKAEIACLTDAAGLDTPTFSERPPYWHAIARTARATRR
jgi:SAM-dependent methyltransferase